MKIYLLLKINQIRWRNMSPIINTEEEIENHKLNHFIPQPKTCDLCWLEIPFTIEEITMINQEEEIILIQDNKMSEE